MLPSDSKIILFDGVCNLCNRSVQFVIRHDRKQRFLFASLQGPTGRQLVEKFHIRSDSFVLIEGDKAYIRSAGALRVAGYLDGAWPLLRVFGIVPRFIRDAVYKWIAQKRYGWFGKADSCWVATPDLRSRFLDG